MTKQSEKPNLRHIVFREFVTVKSLLSYLSQNFPNFDLKEEALELIAAEHSKVEFRQDAQLLLDGLKSQQQADDVFKSLVDDDVADPVNQIEAAAVILSIQKVEGITVRNKDYPKMLVDQILKLSDQKFRKFFFRRDVLKILSSASKNPSVRFEAHSRLLNGSFLFRVA